MYVKHLIDKILITLEVENTTVLFILLTKKGEIHRKGDGSPQGGDMPLATGHSSEGHFDALMMTIDESIFAYSGVVKYPQPQGRLCQFTIIFNGADGAVDYPFRVVYGEDSQGPPVELAQILINAVKLTEPWYQQQLLSQQPKEAPAKKWWKLW